MNIISAENPRYADPAGDSINLDVLFEEFDAPLPFTAHRQDSEPYGQELFELAQAGEFGPVAEYVPVPIAQPPVVDPVEKLRRFLAANPDVAAVI